MASHTRFLTVPPRTTKPEPGHKIFPYLLRGIEIMQPNQVWPMDITYIPMARGRARHGARRSRGAERLADLGGAVPAKNERTPAKFDAFVKAEIARGSPILKAASVTAN